MTDWVPYQQRRSTGGLVVAEQNGKVEVSIEVAGLGYLVLTVDTEINRRVGYYVYRTYERIAGKLTD